MASVEFLRRHAEEFFGFSPDIFTIPEEAEVIAASMALSYEMPELEGPIKKFLENVAAHPYVEAVAFILDAWKTDTGELAGFIYPYYLTSEESIPVPEWSEVGMPNFHYSPVFEVLHRSKGFVFTNAGYYCRCKPQEVMEKMIDLVRETFEKQPGLFGMNRVEDEPPSGFVIALVQKGNNE